jgi:glycosyltransferase involved in cell wall biosynthesis
MIAFAGRSDPQAALPPPAPPVSAATPAGAAGAPCRVLHVISTLLPGGTETAVLRLIRSCDPRRYQFRVAYLRGDPELAADFAAAGAPATPMGLRRKADPACLLRLWRYLRRERFDLVHTHMDLADYYGAFAARLAGVRGVVSTKHNADEFRTRRTWKRYPFLALERAAYELADAVIVVSDGVGDFLARSEHLPRRKLVTIRNGVDARITEQAIARGEARRRLSLDRFDPVIGTVGRLAPQKGQIDLLRALPAITRLLPGAALAIAGEGPSRPVLEQEARQLGIADRVVFLGHRRDVPAVLSALDLFVLPSLWEGMPLALLEAMALGCPVVAARAVGVEEVLRDGVEGLLVPRRDPAALAEAALRLLRHPSRARALAEAARARALGRHSLEAVAREVEALYQRILEGGR